MNFPPPPTHEANAIANGARQQQQAHSQPPPQYLQAQQAIVYHPQHALMNGLNGGQLPGAMAGFPAPAGHTAELSYIHAMVEDLSRQLAENKRVLEDVVTGVGRVRVRARAQQMGNE